MTPKIENIIVKYLSNQASASELEALDQWLKIEANILLFKEYIKINHLINHNMKQFDAERTKKQLLELINKDKRVIKLRSFQKTMKYAAAAILIIALASTYFLKDQIFDNPIEQSTPIIVNNQIEPGTEKATLTLETGEVVALEKGTTYQTQNASSNGEEIIYEAGSKNNQQLVYNTMSVPRGGQFFMKLSDGTKVWLNSESEIKYPVSFIDGQTRQVELVYGEAYFEVSPSTEHKGSDFKVFNNNQEVQVLGTEFNIKAYQDETNIYTTLVEGKVSIHTANQDQILVPGEQAILNTVNNRLQVTNVEIFDEISWKDGLFSFKRKPLNEIMHVLSRWYDMDVTFENQELETIGFNGALHKSKNIESILETIKNFGAIKNYEINNKTITLK